MLRQRFLVAVFVWLTSCGFALAQLPSVIYTWNGTGDTREWNVDASSVSFSTVSQNTAGELTIQELGDEFQPGCGPTACPDQYGKSVLIRDNGNRVRESSFASGGLDLTGLQFLEMDIRHSGTGDVQVQPYIGTGMNSTYTWFGPAPDYAPSGTPWTIPAGSTPTTVRIPISSLTEAQQAYNRVIGFKALEHVEQG